MYSYISMTRQKITISAPAPILPGSISVAHSTCGRKHCACHTDPEKLHGPFYRWTGFIKGKRTTKTIDEDTARECQKRIDNYKKLRSEIEKALANALDAAPWINNDG
jgi:hypothetical protein